MQSLSAHVTAARLLDRDQQCIGLRPACVLVQHPWHESAAGTRGLGTRACRTVSRLSPQAYASARSVSIDTATRDLRELVTQGHPRTEGTTRDRRSILAE